MVSGLDFARGPHRAPLTAHKKGFGYENGLKCVFRRQPRPQGLLRYGARAEEDPGQIR
jgi:hypothetical protein